MRWLSYATIYSALSGFIIMSIAAWALGASGADQFQAYWGLFFALGGCADGLMQETTRGVSNAQHQSSPGNNAQPWKLGGWIALIAVLGVTFTSGIWMPLIVDSHQYVGTAILALGLAGYIFQAVLSGVLSGLALWHHYASLLALDATLRLVLSFLAWFCEWGLGSFMLITVIGAAAWLVVLAGSPHRKLILSALTDVNAATLRRRTLSAMAATGASAALITGFPVFVQVSQGLHPTTASSGVTVAGVILAVSLTRAPILVPLTRFQSALIVRFVDNKERLTHTLLMPVAAVLSVGLLGALAAWAVGPWLLTLLYGEDFWVPGLVLAIFTFASACTGTLIITGAASLAIEKHSRYVAGWIIASVVAFGVLLLPFPLSWGVCAALVIGPLSGTAVHLAGMR
ncbi:hypothetical protein GSS88_07315 [Corynebacterium sp. 3HC-13]|uniref:hypothetical protein n=1 Tax=Corynebacterium poyangense TaxID=2684405 RepID=UPI001CCE7C26|nr:hypothetical protein [Corynebacterium poyangense]MBZ8177599.1 hypothetical protein [Corynebacterium poyangense]